MRALIHRSYVLALVSLVAGALGISSFAARAQPIVVFAAASLKDALDDAGNAFKISDGTDVKLSYAGSLALARQLEQGAPADIFASADQDSMNYAVSKNSIKTASRFDLLQNRLVVIAAKNSNIQSIGLTVDGLKQAVGTGRISTGEVNTVPVGKYAKAALQKLGLWSEVEPRLAQSDNVRAAMNFVARGEAPLGIVYATDAAAEPGVRVVATFPADSHPPIVYPFALTAGTKTPAAPKFLAFLRTDAARTIFEKQGFTVLK
jgi:molybdate transport system substrate-binding protein